MKTEPQWPSFAPFESKPRDAVSRERTDKQDARGRLIELKGDLREAKARVREVLEAVAAKYDIPAKDVSYAIDGYADDMLADLAFGIERDLEQAADEEGFPERATES